MENIETLIQGSEKLTSIFGYWPDFHDAEVLELHFLRGQINAEEGQFDLPALTISMDLKEWALPAEPGILRQIWATMRFEDVDNFRMEGFNYQNAILGLYIGRVEKQEGSSLCFSVDFNPAFGMGATFECTSIEVVDARSRVAERNSTT
jgi:immunity protein 50 of polymorphic toxin system